MSNVNTAVFDTLSVAHLSNGVELTYDVAGQGPPLVLIHGVMGDWRSWDAQWDVFCTHFTCLRYSRRYNYPNRNQMPSPHHSALVEAEDLRLLMDHLGWSNAILVGSSYGAFIALALAAKAPERCLALVLSEPPMMRYAAFSAKGQQAEGRFRTQVIAPANAAFRVGEDELGARLMTGGINGANAAALNAEAMQRRLQNIQAMKMLALSSDEFPWIAPHVLASLSMPILLLAGQATPEIHAEIFRNISGAMPQAQQVWLPDAGHSTSRDNPEAFNRVVLEFLNHHVHS